MSAVALETLNKNGFVEMLYFYLPDRSVRTLHRVVLFRIILNT